MPTVVIKFRYLSQNPADRGDTSDDDALWNALLLQVTPEENTIVAMSIIVCRDSDPIDLGISWENRKAHARMKGNGAFIHRRSNGAGFGTSELAHHLKEVLVEATANSLSPRARMDADKVNICLVWGCLRPEAYKKTLNLRILLDHKTCWLEMLKKEPREQTCHGAASPPFIYNLDNRNVILYL